MGNHYKQAKLVAQDYNQEDCNDFEKTFAQVACLEAIIMLWYLQAISILNFSKWMSKVFIDIYGESLCRITPRIYR